MSLIQRTEITKHDDGVYFMHGRSMDYSAGFVMCPPQDTFIIAVHGKVFPYALWI